MSKTHGAPTAARTFFQESVRASTSSSLSGSKSRDVLRAVPVPGGCPRFHVGEYTRVKEALLQRDDVSPDLQTAFRSTPPTKRYDLARLLAISPAELWLDTAERRRRQDGRAAGRSELLCGRWSRPVHHLGVYGDLPLSQRVPGAQHHRLRRPAGDRRRPRVSAIRSAT